MKKNKIIPFSLLFITLTFLELFCIVKYSDVFYFPLAVGVTMLGSAYLLMTEIKASITSFLRERDKTNEIKIDETVFAEKEEAAKLAKATYVLEKRILNLLEERILMPEENMENLSTLNGEIVRAVKASIKYERENANHLADVISSNSGATDNSMSPADLSQILSKFDALALEIKSNQLTMNAVKEQLQTITDIARQISNNRVQYVSQPAPATTEIEPVSEEISPVAEEMTDEISVEEDMPEFVDTLTNSVNEVAVAEETPVAEAPVTDDPNKQMSPEDIAALFAASTPEPEPDPVVEEPSVAEIPTPASDDPNKKMSPEDIAALFAASTPEPEPEPVVEEAPVVETPAPASDDPNKKMSPEDIAALFASANLDLEPEPNEPAPKTAIEALAKPEVTPVADDPNKQMSPEDIAALFASVGQ